MTEAQAAELITAVGELNDKLSLSVQWSAALHTPLVYVFYALSIVVFFQVFIALKRK